MPALPSSPPKTLAQKRRLSPRGQERALTLALSLDDWSEVADWCALGVDRRSDQPLLVQVVSGNPEAGAVQAARIDTLVNRFGQNVNGRSITGFSPLRSALLYGSVEAVRRLMELGANPNEVVRPSWLPLWLAAIHEAHRPFTDQKLLALWKGGADTEVRSPEGLNDQALMQEHLIDMPDDPHVQAMARALTMVHEDKALRTTLAQTPVGEAPAPRPRL